ncbi:MAG: hypothetical protein M3Z09_04285 [Acidobacteriota bacterium]|nr:hypothetical protein [Acidobacteriota bacterium]
MSLFDLLFLASVLALLVSLGRTAWLLFTRRASRAWEALLRIGYAVIAYLLIVVLVSAFSPARVYVAGEKQCFDDWCVLVRSAVRSGTRVEVGITVLSDARRVTQREFGVRFALEDGHGRTYLPVAESGPPVSTAIWPNESFTVMREFEAPPELSGLHLLVSHTGLQPGKLVIADRESLFHRHARMLLPVHSPTL